MTEGEEKLDVEESSPISFVKVYLTGLEIKRLLSRDGFLGRLKMKYREGSIHIMVGGENASPQITTIDWRTNGEGKLVSTDKFNDTLVYYGEIKQNSYLRLRVVLIESDKATRKMLNNLMSSTNLAARVIDDIDIPLADTGAHIFQAFLETSSAVFGLIQQLKDDSMELNLFSKLPGLNTENEDEFFFVYRNNAIHHHSRNSNTKIVSEIDPNSHTDISSTKPEVYDILFYFKQSFNILRPCEVYLNCSVNVLLDLSFLSTFSRSKFLNPKLNLALEVSFGYGEVVTRRREILTMSGLASFKKYPILLSYKWSKSTALPFSISMGTVKNDKKTNNIEKHASSVEKSVKKSIEKASALSKTKSSSMAFYKFPMFAAKAGLSALNTYMQTMLSQETILYECGILDLETMDRWPPSSGCQRNDDIQVKLHIETFDS